MNEAGPEWQVTRAGQSVGAWHGMRNPTKKYISFNLEADVQAGDTLTTTDGGEKVFVSAVELYDFGGQTGKYVHF
jgi:uncharacterized protein (DUF736 family)